MQTRNRPPRAPGGELKNPPGTDVLCLSWPYHRMHGTQDTHRIGRALSDGCIGLCSAHTEGVFDRVPVGTQVKLI